MNVLLLDDIPKTVKTILKSNFGSVRFFKGNADKITNGIVEGDIEDSELKKISIAVIYVKDVEEQHEAIKNLWNYRIELVFILDNIEDSIRLTRFRPLGIVRSDSIADDMESVTENIRLFFGDKADKKAKLEIDKYEIKVVNLSDIIYFESKGHKTRVILKRGNLMVRTMMKDIEAEFSSRNCVRIHAGFMINLKHVSDVHGNHVCMANGDEITIARGKKKTFIQKYTDYHNCHNYDAFTL